MTEDQAEGEQRKSGSNAGNEQTAEALDDTARSTNSNGGTTDDRCSSRQSGEAHTTESTHSSLGEDSPS